MTDDDLNDRIRKLCERRGLKFRCWETSPWQCDDNSPSPWGPGTVGALTWPQAQRLRRKLIAECTETER
jgi:hypothetical protein